jgi:hypothetical protein
MWKKILFLMIAALSMSSLSAQKHPRRMEIKGTVLDVYNGPIANAIIMVDGQKTNSVTDSRGNYKIKVKYGSTRIGVFTFGNGTAEDYIDGRTDIDFNLNTMKAQQLDPYVRESEQGINNGYGKVQKKNLTTEISSIDGTSKDYSTYSSIYDMIQRHVSGVRVSGKNIIIQDSRNFYGYVNPLVVVDGVYMTSVPNIPPSTVKSIEVLKSTAASIYGSRATGGAIIINTKLQAN